MGTNIYTVKWFLQCFLGQIPFSLAVRVWDLFLLEGESILIAMAYNILKIHHKWLLTMNNEDLMTFLTKTLKEDFCCEDQDYVINTSLKNCLTELKSAMLDTPGPLPMNEKPKKEFGVIENIKSFADEKDGSNYDEKNCQQSHEDLNQYCQKCNQNSNSHTSIYNSSEISSFENESREEDSRGLYVSDTSTPTSDKESNTRDTSSRDQVRIHLNLVYFHFLPQLHLMYLQWTRRQKAVSRYHISCNL